LSRTLLVVLAAGLASALNPLPAGAKGLLDFVDKLHVTGHGQLMLQRQDVSGVGSSAYYGQYWNTGTVESSASVHVEGPLIVPGLSVRADVTRTGDFGINETRWALTQRIGDGAVTYGDINVRLRGGEFVSFFKQIQGAQFGYEIGKNSLVTGFYANEKGAVYRETIAGENISGPYFLRAAPIVDGSDVVKVDEQVMRFGVDYILYYETGQLYFEPTQGPPRIIPSTSVISVSYQSLRGSQGGQIMGMRAEHKLGGKTGRLGLSYVEQRAGGEATTKDTAAHRRDVYYGSGTTGPFETTYRPILSDGTTAIINGSEELIADALVVTVDSSENIQREGIDYRADYSRGIVEFYRIVPPTSTVYIKYYYEPRTQGAPLSSSRRVMGMDLSYPLTKKIGLESEFALGGQLEDDPGLAFRTGLRATFDKFNVAAEYRQVAPDFTYVNSVGFQRNEKGVNFRAGYDPSKHVRTTLQLSDLQTSQGFSFGSSPYGYGGYGGGVGNFSALPSAVLRQEGEEDPVPTLDTRSQRLNLGVDLDFPKWPHLRISRDTMANSGGNGGDNEYENIALDLTYAPEGKPYQVTASHSIGTQDYLASSPTGEADDVSTVRLGTETTSTRMGVTWKAAKDLDFSGSFNTNDSQDSSATGRSTNSQMMQANVRWRATDKLNIGLSHLVTKSTGSSFGSFFPGGYFGGYGSGGARSVGPQSSWPARSRQTDGDGDDTTDVIQSRYVDEGTRLDIDYRPARRISINAGLGVRRYESGGDTGYRADSDQKDIHVSASYMLSNSLSLTGSFMHNDVTFLEEGRGSIDNNDVLLSLGHASAGQGIDWNVQYHRMQGTTPSYSGTGTGTSTGGDSLSTGASDVSARVGYGFSERSKVYVSLLKSDLSGGFGDTKKFDAGLGYQLQISPTMALDFSYRLMNSDGNSMYGGISGAGSTSQGYSANVLSLTLNANFAGGPRPRATAPGYQSPFGSQAGRGYDSSLNSTFGDYRTGRPSTYQQGYGATQPFGTSGSGAFGSGGYSSGTPYRGSGSFGGF